MADLVNNLVVWRTVAASSPAGANSSPGLILIAGLVPPAIGLVLWYLVARRASNIARWIVTMLVILGTIAFTVALARGSEETRSAPFLIAAAAELLKLGATGFLFTPSAKGWFARNRTRH